MFIKHEEINNLPKALYEKIKMSPEETRTFVFSRAAKPALLELPSEETIVDLKGNTYRIAPFYKKEKGEPVAVKVQFTVDRHWLIQCRGSVSAEKALAEFLTVHPLNRNSDFRDLTREEVFFLKDPIRDAKANLEGVELQLEAMNIVANANDQTVLEFAYAFLGASASEDATLNRNGVMKFASENPGAFLSGIDGGDLAVVSTINRAVDAKVIGFKGNDYYWIHTEEVLFSIVPGGVSAAKQFASYLMQEKNSGLYDQINGAIAK